MHFTCYKLAFLCSEWPSAMSSSVGFAGKITVEMIKCVLNLPHKASWKCTHANNTEINLHEKKIWCTAFWVHVSKVRYLVNFKTEEELGAYGS